MFVFLKETGPVDVKLEEIEGHRRPRLHHISSTALRREPGERESIRADVIRT